MGMPLGGGSSWAHHGDGFELLDDNGALWARVQTLFNPPSLDFLAPTSTYDSSYVFSIRLERNAVKWTWRVDGEHTVAWKHDTAPERMVPTHALRLDARVIVQPGAVTVLDAKASPRLQVRLGGPEASWNASHTGELRVDDKPIVSFCIMGNVRATALSLP